MKKSIYLLLLLLTGNFCKGQNLVPNPSFENYYNCPSGLGQVYECRNWSTFGRTPDYFNVCATDTSAGVPVNNYGTEAASSGNAYCGIVTLSAPMRSEEYIGAQLMQPLTAGATYYASFKISKCDHSICSDDKIILASDAEGICDFYLTDIAGREISSGEFSKTITIDTQSIPSGVYFYRVKNKNTIIESGKIIK